ncbi:hypothetical protein [Mesorhizobium huakuii]|uniref:Uncharacterized protein n=1 Tax=Mesorhizobium huakuii TaxID=28104 RepID=A0A7G6T4X5_9HYPH|nr:hypothetical protein [Mesorhizobium huakuii]QND61807.1 hypothetical protein HB778_37005 [Mesorhizobium huakuii]
MLAARPGAKMLPVGGVSAPGVGRACCLDVIASALGEPFQVSRKADNWRRRRCRVFPRKIVRRLSHGEDDIDDIGEIVGDCLRRRMIDDGGRAVGRSGGRVDVFFGLLRDENGHFSP